jgi:hypothetical protein
METMSMTPEAFTLLDLLRALQDVASSDAEAVAVLLAMIRAGHVRLAGEPALAA